MDRNAKIFFIIGYLVVLTLYVITLVFMSIHKREGIFYYNTKKQTISKNVSMFVYGIASFAFICVMVAALGSAALSISLVNPNFGGDPALFGTFYFLGPLIAAFILIFIAAACIPGLSRMSTQPKPPAKGDKLWYVCLYIGIITAIIVTTITMLMFVLHVETPVMVRPRQMLIDPNTITSEE